MNYSLLYSACIVQLIFLSLYDLQRLTCSSPYLKRSFLRRCSRDCSVRTTIKHCLPGAVTWKSAVEHTFVTRAVLVDTFGVTVRSFSKRAGLWGIFQEQNQGYPTDPTLTTSKRFSKPLPYGISVAPYSVKRYFKEGNYLWSPHAK